MSNHQNEQGVKEHQLNMRNEELIKSLPSLSIRFYKLLKVLMRSGSTQLQQNSWTFSLPSN